MGNEKQILWLWPQPVLDKDYKIEVKITSPKTLKSSYDD